MLLAAAENLPAPVLCGDRAADLIMAHETALLSGGHASLGAGENSHVPRPIRAPAVETNPSVQQFADSSHDIVCSFGFWLVPVEFCESVNLTSCLLLFCFFLRTMALLHRSPTAAEKQRQRKKQDKRRQLAAKNGKIYKEAVDLQMSRLCAALRTVWRGLHSDRRWQVSRDQGVGAECHIPNALCERTGACLAEGAVQDSERDFHGKHHETFTLQRRSMHYRHYITLRCISSLPG